NCESSLALPWKSGASLQGGPLAVQALALNLADLGLADGEALGHQLTRRPYAPVVVLGVHHSQEDFLALAFRELSFVFPWRHVAPSGVGAARMFIEGPAWMVARGRPRRGHSSLQ